ncbi:MAG: hypothetical protein FWC16_11340 [Defluviitaleaceae bacterium]|nr:hypothetical protein [Defluviitaleaceae bacterium]MCL2275512.1 hypothetical protein [Defluviitaleaceae bacterium]
MKLRALLAGAALVGVLGITACSSGALPENNEGNYNGERLVDSVTRSTRNTRNTRNVTDNARGLGHNYQNDGVRHNNTRNTRGLGNTVNHTFDYTNDTTNRDYVNNRAHRNLRVDEANIALRDGDCRTVPCTAVEGEVQPITPEVPVKPSTRPQPAPETDNGNDGNEAENTTPEPKPVPAKKVPSVQRVMK